MIVVRNCPGCNGYLVEVTVTTLTTGVTEDDGKIAAAGLVGSGGIDDATGVIATEGAAEVAEAEKDVLGVADAEGISPEV